MNIYIYISAQTTTTSGDVTAELRRAISDLIYISLHIILYIYRERHVLNGGAGGPFRWCRALALKSLGGLAVGSALRELSTFVFCQRNPMMQQFIVTNLIVGAQLGKLIRPG